MYNVPILLTKFKIESVEMMKSVAKSASNSKINDESDGTLSPRRVSILIEQIF